MISLVSEEIEAYAQAHSGCEDPLLRELREETIAQMDCPQMLSGHLQGQLLYLLGRMISAETAVEVGMFTGYASIYMARSLRENGKLHCLENNPRASAVAKRYFARAKVDKKIEIHEGEALDHLRSIKGPIDLAYIDADKENYINYYEACLERLSPNGLIVADNTLWGGRVLEPKDKQDETTQAISKFNEHILRDNRVESIMLPFRDGLFIIRRR